MRNSRQPGRTVIWYVTPRGGDWGTLGDSQLQPVTTEGWKIYHQPPPPPSTSTSDSTDDKADCLPPVSPVSSLEFLVVSRDVWLSLGGLGTRPQHFQSEIFLITLRAAQIFLSSANTEILLDQQARTFLEMAVQCCLSFNMLPSVHWLIFLAELYQLFHVNWKQFYNNISPVEASMIFYVRYSYCNHKYDGGEQSSVWLSLLAVLAVLAVLAWFYFYYPRIFQSKELPL